LKIKTDGLEKRISRKIVYRQNSPMLSCAFSKSDKITNQTQKSFFSRMSQATLKNVFWKQIIVNGTSNFSRQIICKSSRVIVRIESSRHTLL